MPIVNFSGDTFVAFTDISGFKVKMKDEKAALEALSHFYNAGFLTLRDANGVEGFFISDCGVLFAREGSTNEKLSQLLVAIKSINQRMLEKDYMLTTSIAFGRFVYENKLEFEGIEKNPIYGNAYLQAFLNNETGTPRIQPGQCRLVKRNLPEDLDRDLDDFALLLERHNDNKHLYFYWNLDKTNAVEAFEEAYTDSYSLKYAGMLKALKQNS